MNTVFEKLWVNGQIKPIKLRQWSIALIVINYMVWFWNNCQVLNFSVKTEASVLEKWLLIKLESLNCFWMSVLCYLMPAVLHSSHCWTQDHKNNFTETHRETRCSGWTFILKL